MLDAKKMGHSVYSFARKGELFNKINSICDSNNNKSTTVEIKKIILSKNLLKFSLYLQNIDDDGYNWIIESKDVFLNLLQQTKWKKGLDIFQSYVKDPVLVQTLE